MRETGLPALLLTPGALKEEQGRGQPGTEKDEVTRNATTRRDRITSGLVSNAGAALCSRQDNVGQGC